MSNTVNKLGSLKEYMRSVKEAFHYSFSIAPVESFLISGLSVIYAILPYGTAWLLGQLVNTLTAIVSTKAVDDEKIIWLFAIYALVSATPNLIASARIYIEKSWRFKFQAEMEVLVLKKRAEVDIAHYENPAFQDLVQRAFQRSFWPLLELADIQFDVFRGFIAIIVGSVLATAFSWKIYLIIFACAIPNFIAEYKYGFNVWSIWMKDSPEQRRFVDLRKYFTYRTGVIETKLIQSGNFLLDWMRKILLNFNENQLKAERSKMFQLIISEIIAFGGFVFGAFLILQDVLSGSVLVGSMVYLLSTLSNVRNSFADTLANIARQNERHLIVKDILQFFDTKPLIAKNKNPTKLSLTKPPTIKFENVSFRYPSSTENKWILKNINLTIEPGKKIGLVGNNGAGKTTFIKILCRIYDPTEGRITINGTDLKELDIDEWWSYLAVMLQDYMDYDFITKEAIAVGRTGKETDMEKVRSAAEISQSDEFIKEWEKGFENPIGVEFGGVEPSKGQRQKLAIAKTLYRNAMVMIMDEPTASVDAESEAKIFNSLDSLPNSMTAILISHDFSTIRECDHIFVFDHGELKEEGNHDELMGQNGLYAELFRLQAEGFK